VGVVGVLAARSAQAEKNYLVVIADDVAVDKISSYAGDYTGYAPAYMPNTLTIDTLAARGLRFTHAWATPLCSPTRVSFQTGMQPFRTGIGTALGELARGVDVTRFDMLADQFTGQGYTTGVFGKWHLGTEDAAGNVGIPPSPIVDMPHPARAGWDRYWGSLGGYVGATAGNNYTNWTRVEWRKGGTGTVATETTHATAGTEQVALDWINTRTKPWLAVVAFNAAHSGTTTGSGAGAAWLYDDAIGIQYRTAALSCIAANNCTDRNRQVYQGLVEDMDKKLHTLLNGIDPTILENTVIVVAGDNGTPAPVEESVFAVAGRGKESVYENGVRVPLIVADGFAYLHGFAGPTATIPDINRVIDAKVNTLDLYATLLDDAGIAIPGTPDASSFTPCFAVNDHWCGWMGKRYGYTETFPSNAASANGKATVSYGEDTMVTWYDSVALCMRAEYYDGATDPLQTVPQLWVGIRASRLRDRFTSLHTGVADWANPTGAAVVAFCP
jgi:arylsulfatase A-like enzyme